MRSPSATTRRGARVSLRAALVAVLLGLSSVLAVAAPASADHTINCTPMGDPACRDLAPIVECIWSNGDGTSSIAWGWNNPSGHLLHLDFGSKNKMSPGGDNQGQGTEFSPGVHHNVFVTTVTGTSLQWRLGNNTDETSGSTPACPTKPVPMLGNARALLLGVTLMLAAALPVLVARRTRLRVSA
jgi:hypothetical protein